MIPQENGKGVDHVIAEVISRFQQRRYLTIGRHSPEILYLCFRYDAEREVSVQRTRGEVTEVRM